MNIALILAGGTGSRIGARCPKQFLKIGGREIILRTIDAFERHPQINHIGIVCASEWISHLSRLTDKEAFQKLLPLTEGGGNRTESSYKGLHMLEERFSSDDIVLIHDAARPFVTEKIISENIACAKRHGACVTAIPAQDTVYESCDGKFAGDIPDRRRLFVAQTPQSFRLSVIRDAYQRLPSAAVPTDDGGVCLLAGIPVAFAKGDPRNIKITSPADLTAAEAYCKEDFYGE